MARGNRHLISDELYKAILALLREHRDQPFGSSEGQTAEMAVAGSGKIWGILHDEIEEVTDRVDMTRLTAIQDRGDKLAWHANCDPEDSGQFTLTVDGTGIGPLDHTTTTEEFQTLLNAMPGNPKPAGAVVQGNFFIFPAATCTIQSGEEHVVVARTLYWPAIGNQTGLKVGTRFKRPGFMVKGSWHECDFVQGIGWIVNLADHRSLTVATIGLTAAAPSARDTPANGNAAVLRYGNDNKWKVTRTRVTFKHWDHDSTIEPGTRGRLIADDSGLVWDWLGCSAVPEFSAIPLDPP